MSAALNPDGFDEFVDFLHGCIGLHFDDQPVIRRIGAFKEQQQIGTTPNNFTAVSDGALPKMFDNGAFAFGYFAFTICANTFNFASFHKDLPVGYRLPGMANVAEILH